MCLCSAACGLGGNTSQYGKPRRRFLVLSAELYMIQYYARVEDGQPQKLKGVIHISPMTEVCATCHCRRWLPFHLCSQLHVLFLHLPMTEICTTSHCRLWLPFCPCSQPPVLFLHLPIRTASSKNVGLSHLEAFDLLRRAAYLSCPSSV